MRPISTNLVYTCTKKTHGEYTRQSYVIVTHHLGSGTSGIQKLCKSNRIGRQKRGRFPNCACEMGVTFRERTCAMPLVGHFRCNYRRRWGRDTLELSERSSCEVNHGHESSSSRRDDAGPREGNCHDKVSTQKTARKTCARSPNEHFRDTTVPSPQSW